MCLVYLHFYLKAGQAVVAPPLSTILGNMGLRTLKFCEDYNLLTKDFLSFLVLSLYLKIDLLKKSWDIFLKFFLDSKIFWLVSYKITEKVFISGGLKEKVSYKVNILNIFLLGILKYYIPGHKVKYMFYRFLGIIKSCSLLINS